MTRGERREDIGARGEEGGERMWRREERGEKEREKERGRERERGYIQERREKREE